MSDIYSAGDNLGDSSFLDTSSSPVSAPDPSPFVSGSSVIPGFTSSGGLDASNLFANITAPQNLPASTGTGITGALGDLSKLVTSFYAGVTQATMAKSAADIAAAKAANQLQTIKTTPNIWLVAGVAAAGFFALEMMDRGK